MTNGEQVIGTYRVFQEKSFFIVISNNVVILLLLRRLFVWLTAQIIQLESLGQKDVQPVKHYYATIIVIAS